MTRISRMARTRSRYAIAMRPLACNLRRTKRNASDSQPSTPAGDTARHEFHYFSPMLRVNS